MTPMKHEMRVEKDGKTWLAPENPNFPPLDITDHEYVHVWGVVTYDLHKL